MAAWMASSLLRLEYAAELIPAGGCEICACLAAPVQQQGKEAAGHAFHAFARRQSGLDEPEPEGAEKASTVEDTKAPSANDFDDQPPPGTEYRSKGKKKRQRKSDQVDYYALLGLQQERWTATEQQIKLAYRRQALENHPDKAGAAVADEATKLAIEAKFLTIQEAYDVLSDPVKRREYDSVDDFDDSLPVDCNPADFFKVFAPAFRRNTRWSVAQPVPEVGDESTPYANVDKFYDFWFGFKSWREFPHPDEEDTEQAESREERRWIERYNAKLRESAKKEEKRRLKEFVEAAYRRDPRILKQREEERAARERRKQEKQAAARAIREAQERRAAEEAAAAAAAEAAAAEEAAEAKKVRQKEKKAMQKERQRLRSLCSDLGTDPLKDDRVERLCSSLSLEPLQSLCDRLSAAKPSQRDAVLSEHAGAVEDDQAAAQARAKSAARAAAQQIEEAAKSRAKQERAARAREWDEEEVRMLEKAMARFPQGTAKRWEQVSAYVRTRTVDEVLEMVKHGLKAARFAPNQNGYQIAKKRQANTQIQSGATQRFESFTDVDLPDERAEASAPAPSSSQGESVPAGPRAKDSSAELPDGAVANGHAPAPVPAPAPAPTPAPATAKQKSSQAASKGGDDAWSEAQELALVQAMKRYGKELEDRWDRIAAEVAGKSKAQCLKRFKALRSSFRAKQGDTS